MAGGLSIHVIDVSRGIPAAGMAIEVWAIKEQGRERVSSGVVDPRGHYDDAGLASRRLAPGLYAAHFGIGAYYRASGVVLPTPAFLETSVFEFGIADPAQHYHLPLKMTPWGYSLFRGGS